MVAEADQQLDLDGLEDGGEQLGLVRELVVQRTAADPGLAGDALGADGGIAVLSEESTSGLDEGAPRRCRAVGLCPALHGHHLTSIQSVCNFQTDCL